MAEVSYNRNEASRITEELGQAVTTLNSYMGTEYETLRNTFETNWIGPDEIAFMNSYLKDLKVIIENVNITGSAMSTFICDSAKTMVDFQNAWAQQLSGEMLGNEIENRYPASLGSDGSSIYGMGPRGGMDFSGETQLGLTGANSAEQLTQGLEDYTRNVQEKIGSTIGAVENGKAFVASEADNMGIQKYIQDVAESAKRLTDMVNQFKNEILPQLITDYNEQASKINEGSVSSASGLESHIDEVI